MVGFSAWTSVTKQDASSASLRARLDNATAALRREEQRSAALQAALRKATESLQQLEARAAPATAGKSAASPSTSRATTGRSTTKAAIGSSHNSGQGATGFPTEDPTSRITHAPWGECRGHPPRGLQHPDCRWVWDEGQWQPYLIVELGGNVGDDLENFAKLYPSARIHSFEPVGKYYKHLSERFANHAQVELHRVGASDGDAEAAFRIDGDTAGSSQFGQAHSGPRRLYENVTLRDVHQLFTEVVAAERREIDVLSINCEGCEYAVLERLQQTGWLDRFRFVQVSWHASAQISRRIARRCSLAKELHRRLRPSYIADFGWEGWSKAPRSYAVDARFLGSASPAEIGMGNGLPQAQSDLNCSGATDRPRGADKLDEDEDPASGHLTWPQTALGDIVSEVLRGRSFSLPAPAPGQQGAPVVVEVGAGSGHGTRFRQFLTEIPGAAHVHSFEPVPTMLEKLRRVAEAANNSATGRAVRVVWPVGLSSEDGRGQFRVWSASATGSATWEGREEVGDLWDAQRGMLAVSAREGQRPVDLLYLNCEGCEYEVLARLAASGMLEALPRIAVSWHGGGAPWQRRCQVDELLRTKHRLVRAANSWEFWVLPGVQVQDHLRHEFASARSSS